MILLELVKHHMPKRVLHVGASHGQEAPLYRRFGVEHVTWIEALESECAALKGRLKGQVEQRVIQALVLDNDGEVVDFHIASNRGVSSSVFPLGRHKQAYPHISYSRTVTLSSHRLDSILSAHRVPVKLFDTLVMDIQGAELRALRGIGAYLDSIRAAVIEIAPVPLYDGGCAEEDVQRYMLSAGFEVRERIVDSKVNAGDALYVRG